MVSLELRVVFAACACALVGCSNPFDLCPPTQERYGFFSSGDCWGTRASLFRGHEWLTFLAHRDLPSELRFSNDEINAMIEGNRRVDFPKELLVHLSSSPLAYKKAVDRYHAAPENQPLHFLLDDRSTSEEAAVLAHQRIRQTIHSALATWTGNRERALALIGRSCHIVQDSASRAHTVREPDNEAQPWCIRKVKAFLKRAPGHLTPDIEFHGTQSDTIGHTTPQDSIYRAGRDCRDPDADDQVEACLSENARHARLLTREFLPLVRQMLFDPSDVGRADTLIDQFVDEHLAMCSD